MERNRALDVIGSSAVKLSSAFLVGITLLCLAAGAHAQTSTESPDVSCRSLLAQQRWDEAARMAEALLQRSPELEYCYGMALARMQRWEESTRAFERGAHESPRDKRFPIELAGVAFQQKDYPRAARELKQAVRLDPRDAYANDFLATLYFMDGNLPATLKYWNRAGKPVLANIASEPRPRTSPVLLDRAFEFAPGSVMTADGLQVTQERLDLLGVFSSYRFELLPKPSGDFDLLFRGTERNGWGDTKLEGLLRLLRNLPYQTVNPEFFNLGGKGANIVSLLRWDVNKQRLATSFSAPLRGDPKWQYRLNADLRKETWELTSGAPPFVLRKAEAGAQIQSSPRAGWSWMSGVAISELKFRDLGVDAQTAGFLKDGWELKYGAQLNAPLLSIPERRFTTSATAGLQFGSLWSVPRTSFAKTTAGLKASWLPRARSDDYAITAQLRWGKSFGEVPFDELFMLGMERDNDLWMHAHAGTRAGRKGSAPLGSGYALFNWELDKDIHRGAWFLISAGPVLDLGKVTGATPQSGALDWLCDAGVQVKVRLFGGVGVSLSYGRDLRGGRNVFYPAGLTTAPGTR